MTDKTTKPVKVSKKPPAPKVDDELDRQLEESFPASDPPSITQPRHHPDQPKR